MAGWVVSYKLFLKRVNPPRITPRLWRSRAGWTIKFFLFFLKKANRNICKNCVHKPWKQFITKKKNWTSEILYTLDLDWIKSSKLRGLNTGVVLLVPPCTKQKIAPHEQANKANQRTDIEMEVMQQLRIQLPTVMSGGKRTHN